MINSFMNLNRFQLTHEQENIIYYFFGDKMQIIS